MENIIKEDEIKEEKNIDKINNKNIIQNQEQSNNNKINDSNKNQVKLNLNSKYDNALLEELNNSKTKSWRMDITNATQEEEKNRINKIKSNNQKENEEIDKDDRFKDFEEILYLEENKDKKRKNRSIEKIIFSEKIGKIPKPSEKIKNNNDNSNKRSNQENINLNKNSSTLSELNKCIGNKSNNSEDLENKKNENDDSNKNVLIINQGKPSNLSEVINNTIDNEDNKYKNINLEYSDDKKTYEERKDIKDNIKNNLEIIKDEKKTIDCLYHNFIDLFDKNNKNNKDNNNINRDLFGKNNMKKQNQNLINTKKTNHQLKVSKSCNIRNNFRGISSYKDNNFIYPNKSQNIKRSVIYDKNTINIQLSIKRKTRSAKDIKKHMSYYLMEENIKNPKDEVDNLDQFMNKYLPKRNYNSNGLNSFLSLQVSCNNINSKNQINYNNKPFNIFKYSFKDKIKKKMNKIISRKNYKSKRAKAKNNYINLEFFEESKQDNLFGKATNELFGTKNKMFEIQTKKDCEKNFFKSQNNFYNKLNKNKENNIFLSNPKISQKNDNINNYLFKTYSSNMNHRKIFSFQSDEYKSLDYFKEKNEIFGTRFNYNSNSNRIKNFEFEYNYHSNDVYNTTKNILYPKMRTSKSFTSVFQNRLNNNHKEAYSFLYNKNGNYRNNYIERKTNVFSSNFYI